MGGNPQRRGRLCRCPAGVQLQLLDARTGRSPARSPRHDPRCAVARGSGIRSIEFRGDPCPPDDPERLACQRNGDHLAADRVPVVRLGRHGDHRQARRHVRQAATAGMDSPGAHRRNGARRPVRLAAGLDRGPHHPGHRRRHIPAVVLDHPRRIPGWPGPGEHRADVSHPRRRRRIRASGRRPDRRAPELAVALLDSAACHGRGCCVHLALDPGIAGPLSWPAQLGSGCADDHWHVLRAHRDRPGYGLGLDRPAYRGTPGIWPGGLRGVDRRGIA
jgi:hypothetical protein